MSKIQTACLANLFILSLFLFSCGSNNEHDNSSFKIQFGKITISSADSLRSGINFLQFNDLSEPLTVTIKQNDEIIPLNWRGNQLLFPLFGDKKPVLTINKQVVELPFSSHGKLSIKHDSTWVALSKPFIGKYQGNVLIFAVYIKKDKNWIKYDSPIRFQPWMDMGNGNGHGSQYNVQPQLIDTLGATIQRGTVMFSMPGKWELRFFVNGDTLKGPIQVDRN